MAFAIAVASTPMALATDADWDIKDQLQLPEAEQGDTVIAETDPEAVEACERAGTGFKKIGSTETCIRISGYVRFQVGFGSIDD